MGISDDVRRLGPDFLSPARDRLVNHNWRELCVCGHLDRYHSESTGGAYQLPATVTKTRLGEQVTVSYAFVGCVGAVMPRGMDDIAWTNDRETHTDVGRIVPTCPCEEFRPVAKVDRPNRMFNQRMPKDRESMERHPFQVGVRALITFLNGRVAAETDPDWVDQELDRRFLWIDGRRVCGMSRCKETDDVWPVFVDGERSELRCGPHRSRP